MRYIRRPAEDRRAGPPAAEGDEVSTTVSPTTSTERELEQVERRDATTGESGFASISERENREIEAANASDNALVVLGHALASSGRRAAHTALPSTT